MDFFSIDLLGIYGERRAKVSASSDRDKSLIRDSVYMYCGVAV